MTETITRAYPTHAEARSVVTALEAAGVKHGDISVLASNADNWHTDKTPATYPDRDLDGRDDRAEAAAGGAGVGAAVGGTAGLLTGLGLLAIPGVGPVVAAGWLVATLTGAVAGGATGGIVGALTQAGVGTDEADAYAETVRRGGAVVSVRTDEARRSNVLSVMDSSALNMADRTTAYRKAGWDRFDPAAQPMTADQIKRERELYR